MCDIFQEGYDVGRIGSKRKLRVILFCNTKKPWLCGKNYHGQLMASNRVEFIRGGE